MSALWTYLGAALLAAAALPQAWRLLRTRRADDIGWPFVLLNLSGILLLGVRSAELGERAFVAANAVTAGFWALTAAVKARDVSLTAACVAKGA